MHRQDALHKASPNYGSIKSIWSNFRVNLEVELPFNSATQSGHITTPRKKPFENILGNNFVLERKENIVVTSIFSFAGNVVKRPFL